MKRVLASKKGASSILVVLLLVVLVVFGIAALTTSLSNLRLGQKSAEWNTGYYTAEAQAQECYAHIDKAVHDAFDSTEDDIEAAINSRLHALDFGTLIEASDDSMLISFETWNGNIGITASLSLNLADENSLRPVVWQEMQAY